jgi:type I restriction enzyme S subunit
MPFSRQEVLILNGMPAGWRAVPLGDCGKWFSGGTPDTGVADYWGGDIPWITASSLHDFYITTSERRVTELGLRNGTRLMPAGTVLFIVRGMSLKTEFRVGIAKRPVAFGQDCKAIVARTDIDPLFLANAIRARTRDILDLVDEAGHGTGRLQTDALAQFEILVPPLTEQRVIAATIGAFDDKIDLNRRMNETLEAIASALFKSWFVDFDPVRAKAEGRQPAGMNAETAALFPSSFDASEIGEIPSGWQVSTIEEEVRVVGGGTPSTNEPAYWEGGTLPWATPKDLSALADPVLLSSARNITELGLSQIGSGLLPKGTVLLSSRAPIGYLAISEVPVAINQGFIGMVCDARLSNYYVLHWARGNMDAIVSRANGTTFLEISKASFRPMPVVVPSQLIIKQFNRFVEPLYRKMVVNIQETETLANIRDAMLPKLISGEKKLTIRKV